MMKGGVFRTNGICPIKFYLIPEFSKQEAIKWKFHVDNSKQTVKNRYHMIIGRDLLEQLPLDIKFSDQTLTQEVTIPMKMVDELDTQNINEIVEHCYETGHINDVTRRTMQILDASYEKADLSDIISKCTYLSKEERTALLKLLLQYEDLFDGTLGTCTTKWIDTEQDPVCVFLGGGLCQ
jgi:hypothetical protein